VIIIVSEETGTISIARDGALERGFDEQKLRDYLTEALVPVPRKKPKYKAPNNEKPDKSNEIIDEKSEESKHENL
jgi:hypothetical protein